MNTVKAKCKKCGREAPVDQFKLHYAFKMMVCPDCFSGKTKKQEETKKAETQRPAGWDQEDEYLTKFHQIKQKETAQIRKIPGTEIYECTCKKCAYKFKYDPYKQIPRSCPFCDENVPNIKTSNFF